MGMRRPVPLWSTHSGCPGCCRLLLGKGPEPFLLCVRLFQSRGRLVAQRPLPPASSPAPPTAGGGFEVGGGRGCAVDFLSPATGRPAAFSRSVCVCVCRWDYPGRVRVCVCLSSHCMRVLCNNSSGSGGQRQQQQQTRSPGFFPPFLFFTLSFPSSLDAAFFPLRPFLPFAG